jgi:hypothetical protein
MTVPALQRLCAMLLIVYCAIPLRAIGQVQPPKPVSVYVNTAQPLSFGAFFQGVTGGSVVVYPDGTRSTTGDIIGAAMGYNFSPALFEVEGLPGTLVSIMNGPDVLLTGSNGGHMTLRIGNSSPVSPFIITSNPPSRTLISVGGTLTVGPPSMNPSGSYSGTFNIIFIEQ